MFTQLLSQKISEINVSNNMARKVKSRHKIQWQIQKSIQKASQSVAACKSFYNSTSRDPDDPFFDLSCVELDNLPETTSQRFKDNIIDSVTLYFHSERHIQGEWPGNDYLYVESVTYYLINSSYGGIVMVAEAPNSLVPYHSYVAKSNHSECQLLCSSSLSVATIGLRNFIHSYVHSPQTAFALMKGGFVDGNGFNPKYVEIDFGRKPISMEFLEQSYEDDVSPYFSSGKPDTIQLIYETFVVEFSYANHNEQMGLVINMSLIRSQGYCWVPYLISQLSSYSALEISKMLESSHIFCLFPTKSRISHYSNQTDFSLQRIQTCLGSNLIHTLPYYTKMHSRLTLQIQNDYSLIRTAKLEERKLLNSFNVLHTFSSGKCSDLVEIKVFENTGNNMINLLPMKLSVQSMLIVDIDIDFKDERIIQTDFMLRILKYSKQPNLLLDYLFLLQNGLIDLEGNQTVRKTAYLSEKNLTIPIVIPINKYCERPVHRIDIQNTVIVQVDGNQYTFSYKYGSQSGLFIDLTNLKGYCWLLPYLNSKNRVCVDTLLYLLKSPILSVNLVGIANQINHTQFPDFQISGSNRVFGWNGIELIKHLVGEAQMSHSLKEQKYTPIEVKDQSFLTDTTLFHFDQTYVVRGEVALNQWFDQKYQATLTFQIENTCFLLTSQHLGPDFYIKGNQNLLDLFQKYDFFEIFVSHTLGLCTGLQTKLTMPFKQIKYQLNFELFGRLIQQTTVNRSDNTSVIIRDIEGFGIVKIIQGTDCMIYSNEGHQSYEIIIPTFGYCWIPLMLHFTSLTLDSLKAFLSTNLYAPLMPLKFKGKKFINHFQYQFLEPTNITYTIWGMKNEKKFKQIYEKKHAPLKEEIQISHLSKPEFYLVFLGLAYYDEEIVSKYLPEEEYRHYYKYEECKWRSQQHGMEDHADWENIMDEDIWDQDRVINCLIKNSPNVRYFADFQIDVTILKVPEMLSMFQHYNLPLTNPLPDLPNAIKLAETMQLKDLTKSYVQQDDEEEEEQKIQTQEYKQHLEEVKKVLNKPEDLTEDVQKQFQELQNLKDEPVDFPGLEDCFSNFTLQKNKKTKNLKNKQVEYDVDYLKTDQIVKHSSKPLKLPAIKIHQEFPPGLEIQAQPILHNPEKTNESYDYMLKYEELLNDKGNQYSLVQNYLEMPKIRLFTEKKPSKSIIEHSLNTFIQPTDQQFITKELYYSFPKNSIYCMEKAICLDAYLSFRCPIDDYSLLPNYFAIGKVIYQQILSKTHMQDDQFLELAKKLGLTFIGNMTAQLISSTYPFVQIWMDPAKEGIHIAEIEGGLHAFYKLPFKRLKMAELMVARRISSSFLKDFLLFLQSSKLQYAAWIDSQWFSFRSNPEYGIELNIAEQIFTISKFTLNKKLDKQEIIQPKSNPIQPQNMVVWNDHNSNPNLQKPKQKIDYLNIERRWFYFQNNRVLPPTHTLKFGKIAAALFYERFGFHPQVDTRLRDYGHYGHSWLRFVTDYLTALLLTLIGANFIDIGSKYGKIREMLFKLDQTKTFIANRPEIEKFDLEYNIRNQSSFQSSSNTIVDKEPMCIEHAKYMQDTYPGYEYSSIDSMYYSGVLESITYLRRSAIYIIVQVVPCLPGRYYNYDDEGFVEVVNKKGTLYTHNHPRNNDKSYFHRFLDILPQSGNYYRREFTLIDKIATGPSIMQCLFKVYPTDQETFQLPHNDLITEVTNQLAGFPISETALQKIDVPLSVATIVDQFLLTAPGGVARFESICDPLKSKMSLTFALSNIQMELMHLQNSPLSISEPTMAEYIMQRARTFESSIDQLNITKETFKKKIFYFLCTRFFEYFQDYQAMNTLAAFWEQYNATKVNGRITDKIQSVMQWWTYHIYLPILFKIIQLIVSPLLFFISVSYLELSNLVFIYLPLFIYTTILIVMLSVCRIHLRFNFKHLFQCIIISSLQLIFPINLGAIFTLSIFWSLIKFDFRLSAPVNGRPTELARGLVNVTWKLVLVLIFLVIPMFIILICYHFFQATSTKIGLLHRIAVQYVVEILEFNQIYKQKLVELEEKRKEGYILSVRTVLSIPKQFFLEVSAIPSILISVFTLATYLQLISIALLLGSTFWFFDPVVITIIILLAIFVNIDPIILFAQQLADAALNASFDDYTEFEFIKSPNPREDIRINILFSLFGYKYSLFVVNFFEKDREQMLQMLCNQKIDPVEEERIPIINEIVQEPIVNGYRLQEGPYVQPSTKQFNVLSEVLKDNTPLRNLTQTKHTKAQLLKLHFEAQKELKKEKNIILGNDTQLEHCKYQAMLQTSKMNGFLALITRQAKPMSEPFPKDHSDRPRTVNFYKKCIDNLYKLKLEQIFLNGTYYDFETYLKTVDPRKHFDYRMGKALFDNTCKLSNSYDAFQKSEEKKISVEDLIKQRLGETKHKPRNIFNPSKAVKGVCGYVAWSMLKILKESHLGNFIQPGKSPEQLEAIIEQFKAGQETIYSFSADGAQFDAHQSSEAFQIDDALMDIAIPIVCNQLDIHGLHRAAILKLSKSRTYTIYVFNKKDKAHKLKMHKSVFSGLPFRTTLGNSFRIFIITATLLNNITNYIQQINRKNLSMMTIFAGHIGDDQCILSKDKDLCSKYAEQVYTYHSQDDQNFNYSVSGMVFKDIKVDINKFDYISRVFYTSGQVKSFKAVEKLMHLGTWLTDPLNPLAQTAQSLKGEYSTYKDVTGLQNLAQTRINELEEIITKKDVVQRSEFIQFSSTTQYAYMNAHTKSIQDHDNFHLVMRQYNNYSSSVESS